MYTLSLISSCTLYSLLLIPLVNAAMGGGASSAIIYSVTQFGSLGGGTYVSILGSGLSRGGVAGTTTIFIGGDECIQNQASLYDSSDSLLVCFSPPHSIQETLDVRVAMTTVDGSSQFVMCISAAACKFTYSYAYTPVLYPLTLGGSSSLGGAASESTFKAVGTLRGTTFDSYFIRLGGGAGGAGGSVCDVDENSQVGAGGNGGPSRMVDGSGNLGIVTCKVGGDLEAGRYNLSFDVKGFGQPIEGSLPLQTLQSSNPYHFTLRPFISSVSFSSSGLEGGDLLTITGSGFSINPSRNTVELDSTPCQIVSSSLSSITCRIGKFSKSGSGSSTLPPNQFIMGGIGLLHSVYPGNVAFPGLASATLPNSVPREALINSDSLVGFYPPYNSAFDSYNQVLIGFFVPPVSTNYSFYTRGDDNAGVWLSTDASPANQRLIAYTPYYYTSFFNLGPIGSASNTLVSKPVFCEKDVPLFFRVLHQEGIGGDFFDVGLRIHGAESNDQVLLNDLAPYLSPLQQRTYSVQRISISAAVPFVRETQVLTAVGGISGSRFQLLQDGKIVPGLVSTKVVLVGSTTTSTTNTGDISFDAACSVITSAVSGTGGCRYITCSRSAVVVGDQSGFSWTLRFDCPIASGSTFPTLSGYWTTKANVSASVTSKRTVFAGEPLGGTFALAASSEPNAPRSTPIKFDANSNDLKSALSSIGYSNVDVSIDGVPGSYGDVRDGRRWLVTFFKDTDKVQTLAAFSSGESFAVGLSSPNATASVEVLQQGSKDPFFLPTPMDFFRVASPSPAVSVTANGLTAACSHIPKTFSNPLVMNTVYDSPCAFTYSQALTPTVSSVNCLACTGNAITVGSVLIISGSNFLSDELENNIVTLVSSETNEKSSCNVTQATSSQITCSVGHSSQGVYAVSVLVRKGRGFAQVSAGIASLSYSQSITSITPASGSRAGGTLLSIKGTGFYTNASINNVLIGSNACIVVSSTTFEILCRTPKTSDATPTPTAISNSVAPVTASITVNQVTVSGTQFSYQVSLTPLIYSISPAQLSSSVSGQVVLSVSNIEGLLPANISVLIGSRPCSVTHISTLSGSSATVTCLLLRTSPLPLPQSLVPVFMTFDAVGYASVDKSGGSIIAFDAGFRLDSISTSSGSISGGTHLTLTGVGFTGKGSTLSVKFLNTSRYAHLGAPDNTVPCDVISVNDFGTNLTCILSRPSIETVIDFRLGANEGAIFGRIALFVNNYQAPCNDGTGCKFSFLRSATPILNSMTVSGNTATFDGVRLIPPLFVWFGTVLADPSTVIANNDRTSVTVAIPVQTTGLVNIYVHSSSLGNALVGNILNYSNPLSLTSIIPATEVVNATTLGGSSAGGHLLIVTGVGFSINLKRNVVLLDTAMCTVVSATTTTLIVRTPASSKTTPSSITVHVLDSSLSSRMASTLFSSGTYLYGTSSTPTLLSISPTIATKGQTIVFTGTRFGDAMSSGSAITIGSASCSVSTWTNTQITCVLGDSPSGKHVPLVLVGTMGLAKSSNVFLTVPLVLLSASVSVAGAGGGTLTTLEGSGFASSFAQGSINSLTVCGYPAKVVNSTFSSLSFITPAIPTRVALNAHRVYDEVVLKGSVMPAAAAAAVDDAIRSEFTSCSIKIDLGMYSEAIVTRIRFYPKFRDSKPFIGSVFSASNSDTGPWTTLYTVPSRIDEGWNYFDIMGGAGQPPVQSFSDTQAYRYLQWTASAGSSCKGNEVQFVGYALAKDDGSNCNLAVTVSTPMTPYTASVVASNVSTFVMNFGNIAETPAISKISPTYGSALGGEVITITGTGFAPGVDSIYLNSMPCSVISFSNTVITCLTTPRTMIMPKSVRVTIGGGRGLALVNDGKKVYFSYLDKWSALTTWANNEPPASGDTVIVPVGQAILVDVSPPELFLVLIQGELVFDRKNLNFDANYIVVMGGRLEAGTESDPFTHNLTITLHGSRRGSIEIPELGSKCLTVMNSAYISAEDSMYAAMNLQSNAQVLASISETTDPDAIEAKEQLDRMKAIMGSSFGFVISSSSSALQTNDTMQNLDIMTMLTAMTSSDMPGVAGAPSPGRLQGSIDIHGKPRQRVWTKVAQTALAGDTLIITSEDVDFAPGELLAITSSSTNSFESERVIVKSRPSPRQIVIEKPLAYTHESTIFSGAPYGHSNADMRCEIGLLSRNIVIQGDESSESELFGVHTGAFHGSSYRIENTELRHCGQGYLLGRYCIHWHMGSDREESYARANSIHDSFQRAVTIHASNYVRVQDNFAFHIRGHSIFVEDGVEQFNVIEGNLIANTMKSYASLRSDLKPASFWTASPTNIWRHNVAAGCTNDGYWFELPSNPNGPSATPYYCPVNMPLGQFYNNTAHSNGVHGLRIYPQYFPLASPCGSNSLSSPQYFYNFTSYRNGVHGIFGKRNGDLHHIFVKMLENSDDELNWFQHTQPGGILPFKWDPHVKDALLVNTIDPVGRPAWNKRAIYAPQSEYFFVSGATFVNYANHGAIAGCNMCNDIYGAFCAQGGYTVRFEKLSFVNSNVRTFWTAPQKNDIFWDLDGTLSGGVANSHVTPYKGFNNWPECPRDVVGTFAGANVCDNTVAVRRVTIRSVLPYQLDQYSLNITGGTALGNSSGAGVPSPGWDSVMWLPKEHYGYAIPLVTNHFYGVTFQKSIIDWTSMVIRYSEPDYIQDGEYTGLTLSWIDYRYKVKVSNSLQKDAPIIPAGLLPGPQHQFGTSNFPSGPFENSWSVVLSSNLNGTLPNERGKSWGDAWSYGLRLDAVQCPPWGCLPPATGVLSAPVLWSASSTWPGGRVPLEGSDVIINATQYIILDVNPPSLGKITIIGRLEFQDSGSRSLTASSIVVWGSLGIGSKDKPFTNNAEIVLTGTRTSPSVVVDNNLFVGNKVLLSLGDVTFVGSSHVSSWTRLASTAAVGSNVLTLSTSVATSAGKAGWTVGDKIVITPTEYDDGVKSEVETHAIQSISADGKTLTLSAPLAFSHFAGMASTSPTSPVRTVNLAAAVGLLSRSIVIRGELSDASDTHGGHIFVSKFKRSASSFIGTLYANEVEFRNMGQQNMIYGAIDFQYGDFLFSNEATAPEGTSIMGTGSPTGNIISDSSFTSCFNAGVQAISANGISILRSVFSNTRRNGLDFDAGSGGAIIEENLLAGNYKSPDVNADDQLKWTSPQAAIFLTSVPASLKNNYVGGAFDAAYTIRGADCGNSRVYSSSMLTGVTAPYMSGNEAAGVLIGVFILPTRTRSGCAWANGFKVWKAAHVGILAVDALSNLRISNSIVADSHIGISLNFIASSGNLLFSELASVTVIGTSAASSCSASVRCRAMTMTDVTGTTSKSCNSVYGDDVRRIGIMIPQYTNFGKVCETNSAMPVCRPVNRPERMCSMPWEKRLGLPGTRQTTMYLNDVILSSFSTSDCGKQSAALAWNPTQYDLPVPVQATRIVWDATNIDAKFRFQTSYMTMSECSNGKQCDGLSFTLFNDIDGSLHGGQPGSSIVGPNPLLAENSPACTYVQAWPGFYCPGLTYRHAIYESLDGDRGGRKLGALQVSRVSGSSNRTYTVKGPIDDPCPIKMYFAQYHFLALVNTVTGLYIPATEPGQTRIHLISPNASEKLLIQYFLQRPNSLDIFLDSIQVETRNAEGRRLGLPLEALQFPLLSDKVGSSLFSPQLRTTHIVMGGNRRFLDIVRQPSIMLTLTLELEAGQFFNPASVATNLALLLGIDPSRVRVVSVAAAPSGGRRLLVSLLRSLQATGGSGGPQSVQIEIVDVNSTSTVAVNETTGEPEAASVEAAVLQQTKMFSLATVISTLASSGQLSQVGSYKVSSISVEPPVISAQPSNNSLVNSTSTQPTIVIRAKTNSSQSGLKTTDIAIGVSVSAFIIVVLGAIQYKRHRDRMRSDLLASSKSSDSTDNTTDSKVIDSKDVEPQIMMSNPKWGHLHDMTPNTKALETFNRPADRKSHRSFEPTRVGARPGIVS
jgi:hypothetical protein